MWFSRTEMLLGQAAVSRLQASHVAVFGLGGVGSYTVEALARAGVGKLTLIDNDVVGATNLNRQLCALNSTMGRYKADVLAERAADINPDISAVPLCEYYCAENRSALESAAYDYIVDAIDIVSCKLDLICTAKSIGIPIISALGTGNKLDASMFRVADIQKTEMCPLGRVIRRELKKRGILSHKVVYSPEKPLKPEQYETPPPGRRSVPASVPWVPAAAGLMLAGEVVKQLTSES